jgi:hypothetical protein
MGAAEKKGGLHGHDRGPGRRDSLAQGQRY